MHDHQSHADLESVRRIEVSFCRVEMSSHETRDLGEILRHWKASDVDARRVEPGVCIERLFRSSGGTEMHDAMNAPPPQHRLRSQCLRQTHGPEWYITSRAGH